MGLTYSTTNQGIHTFSKENLTERDNLRYVGTDGKIILKRILEK
jgi:hypothetical protein